MKHLSCLPAVNVIIFLQNFHLNSKKECNHVYGCVYVNDVRASRTVAAEDVFNSRTGQVECMLFIV